MCRIKVEFEGKQQSGAMQGRPGFGSHLRGQAQHLLHQLLRLSGLFQEQFHNCRQQLELHLHASQTHKQTHVETAPALLSGGI